MTGEIWKPVVGYEGIYEVSNMGRVRSLERKVLHSHGSLRIQNPRVLKPGKAGRGYLFVGLYNAEGRKLKTIHHLVATAFLPPSEKPDVNHKDFNKSNNAALNLEWCTSMENSHHHQIGEPGLTAAEASARMRAVFQQRAERPRLIAPAGTHPKVKTCENCGAEFTPHHTKRARQKTCSLACGYAQIWKTRRANAATFTREQS